MENGFAWQSNSRYALSARSSVKGIVRSLGKVWEEESDEITTGYLVPETRILLDWLGHLLDAIPSDQVHLKADVMIPTSEPYYQGTEPPADWHNPVPVPFLCGIENKSLLLAFAHRHRKHRIKRTARRLVAEDALKFIGGGAKTAAGYGRFERSFPIAGYELVDKEIDSWPKSITSPHKRFFRRPEGCESWSTIGERKIKEEVLGEIKSRYGQLWDRLTGI